MTDRERFLNSMRFKPVDRFPLWGSLGIWRDTHRRWMKEGLPQDVSLQEYFGLDGQMRAPVNFRFVPPFEERTVEETAEHRIWVDDEGALKKERKDNPELSMPQFLEFPVKNREDFEKLRFRMNPDSAERFPPNWEELCTEYRQRVLPLRLMGDRVGGFFGPLRGMMGLENLLYTFYDDPKLIEDMMDAKLELMLGLIERTLADTDIDFFAFWEDMAYNGGPLLSPELFRRYMVPRYKAITDRLRSHGVDIIFVDSDGDIRKLIPLWLEAGVNGFYPMEAQSHMDVVEWRKEYGRDVLLIGGIDKRVLREGKREIEEEVRRKVPPIIDEGGFIPMIDHSVPPDVPFENYCYFIELLKSYW